MMHARMAWPTLAAGRMASEAPCITRAERSASLMPAVLRLTELQLHTAIFAFTRVPDDADYASVARFLACETLADVRAHFSDVAAHDAGETSPHAEAVPSLLTVVAAVRRVVIVVGAHTPGLRAEVAAVQAFAQPSTHMSHAHQEILGCRTHGLHGAKVSRLLSELC